MSVLCRIHFRWKLLIAPVIAILFVIILSIVSWQALREQQGAMTLIVEKSFVEKEKASELVSALKDVDASLLNMLSLQIAGASEEKIKSASQDTDKKMKDLSGHIEALASDAKVSSDTKFEAAQVQLGLYQQLVKKIVGMADIDQNAALTMKISKHGTYILALQLLDEFAQKGKTKVDEVYATAKKDAKATENMFLLICGTSLLISLVATAWISGAIARAMRRISSAMTKLSQGDRNIQIDYIELTDEIGDMARSLQVFKRNAEEMEEMRAQQERNRLQAEKDKRVTMNRMADEFDKEVHHSVQEVSSSATHLQSNATSLSAAAEQTRMQSQKVEESTRRASDNISAASAAAEELAASIQEITRQVEESAKVAHEAVSEVESTNTTIRSLTEATEKIGSVVQLIQEIASQTNLLALNATIEAARAGEAGKGFAVVASEVKALANQTSKATDEITAQISHVQKQTQDSAHAMEEVGKTITRLNSIASTIAAAVEQQSAATQEISRSVHEASDSTREVVTAISDVRIAAGQTQEASRDVLKASTSLSGDSTRLNQSVEKFLAGFRS